MGDPNASGDVDDSLTFTGSICVDDLVDNMKSRALARPSPQPLPQWPRTGGECDENASGAAAVLATSLEEPREEPRLEFPSDVDSTKIRKRSAPSSQEPQTTTAPLPSLAEQRLEELLGEAEMLLRDTEKMAQAAVAGSRLSEERPPAAVTSNSETARRTGNSGTPRSGLKNAQRREPAVSSLDGRWGASNLGTKLDEICKELDEAVGGFSRRP